MSNIEPPIFQSMTKDILERMKPRDFFLDESFIYGNNWRCTATWYKRHYPGFTDEQCRALELWSDGMRENDYKQLLKKQRKKDVQNRKAK